MQKSKIKTRPSLFSGAMVAALLAGRKTQTRRLIKPQPHLEIPLWKWNDHDFLSQEAVTEHLLHNVYGNIGTPYGSIYADGEADRIWVREAWRTSADFDDLKPSEILARRSNPPIQFECDKTQIGNWSERTPLGRYRHGRFMPRWASRLTLELTDVRVERLRDISHEDAVAEGIERSIYNGNNWRDYLDIYYGFEDARQSFFSLWESIHGAGSYGNPWVWAISFRAVPNAEETK